MTAYCERGHKVLDCGLHVGFETIADGIYRPRAGACEAVPEGPAWAQALGRATTRLTERKEASA